MAKYQVTLKYGDRGKPLSTSRIMTVEASSDLAAGRLAVNQLKSSGGSAYLKKEIVPVAIKKIP